MYLDRFTSAIRCGALLSSVIGLSLFGSLTAAVAAEDSVEGNFVSDIRIEGAAAAEPAALARITNQFTGRILYIEDLVDLTSQITDYYVEAGYITSGAYLPDQNISAGVLNINVVEGVLSEIAIENSGRYSTRYIENAIRTELAEPFNVTNLQDALLKLENDPRIETVKGQIRPTSNRGIAVLDLEVAESDPLSFAISTNNYLSPSIGSEQVQLSMSHLNVLGLADELFLNLGKSDGYEAVSASYSMPIQFLDLAVTAYYSSGDTVVVERPFAEIDIKSETDTQGFSLTKSTNFFGGDFLAFTLGVEKKQSDTSLLGEGFDFSLGSINGKARASIAYAGIELKNQGRNSAWALTSTWRHGIDAWDATEIGGQPDSQFDSLVSQFEILTRLSGGTVLSLRMNSQLTHDSLQSFERLPLGGYRSVKGYRQNQLLKDNGWDLLLDYQIPVLNQLQEQGYFITLVPNVGVARAWDSERYPNIDRAASISSVGISLVVASSDNWSARLDWASCLESKRKQGHELQDDGVYLSLSYDF
ncbi:MAG: ShlB/FhaC/HecB family hemolysin secretion/activation protein [Gammaproteobacteria bacterium]|jgi:hemolysin activation/secretion protein|nr:ShlB/FhaC/HecB family hemolysin secretion/activation protein [Gammaproteobacteria bacterium]